MSTAIIDGTNIDTSVFSYSPPKANPSGGKVVNLYNKHFKESLTLSTPLMLTWGAQEGMDQQKNPTGKFTMSLQFPNKDFPNEDAEAFLSSMRALESKVKADALVYSKEWFGKEIKSADVMEEKFNVMLRHPKLEKGGAEMDFNKPPTLTVKVPCWKTGWQTEIFDEDGVPLFTKNMENPQFTPVDLLKPKTQVVCLIQCGGLWFVNGKVSITWNLKQAMVQKPKPPTIVEGTCFLRPRAQDIETLKAQVQTESVEKSVLDSVIVEDSDAEGDDEDELPPPSRGLERQQSVVVESAAAAVSSVSAEEVVVETVAESAVSATADEDGKKKRVTKKGKGGA